MESKEKGEKGGGYHEQGAWETNAMKEGNT